MQRRRFLLTALGAGALVLARGWSGAARAACGLFGRTPAQTEGPYYKAHPPERMSLLQAGVTGEPLLVQGRVLDGQCRPLAHARLDFWHADAEGEYDNAGYRLRGYQFADAQGRYRLETILPGLYPGRTRHIHVKVTPPGQPTLTTQLYFPHEPANARDGIFDPSLLMKLSRGPQGHVGEFDFILAG